MLPFFYVFFPLSNFMKPSKYLLTLPSTTHAGYNLLFSTKMASLCLVDQEEAAQLEAGLLPDDFSNLEELGLLVADLEQEKRQVFDYYNELNRLNQKLAIDVVLGMACNFDCLYCYEGTLKGKAAMDEATAGQLIVFAKNQFTSGMEAMHLTFYGGETLLYTEQLKNIAAPLQEFCHQKNAGFSFTIVTNGSLLNPKMVKELTALGLDYVKVTLDGPPETHNKFRPFKNGDPSFDIIVDNLLALKGLVQIGLGGNYTKYNYAVFPEVLDIIVERGLSPNDFALVTFNIAIAVQDEFANPEFGGGCASIAEPWLAEAHLYIREECMKRSFNVPKITPEVCAIHIDKVFSVNYDGTLYKCLPFAGRDQFKAGDIWSGPANISQIYHLDHWQKEEKCCDCVYLPLCYGGCRYMEYQRSATLKKVDCKKEFYDATLAQALNLDVQYRYSAK